jgi:hypothetical protein
MRTVSSDLALVYVALAVASISQRIATLPR